MVMDSTRLVEEIETLYGSIAEPISKGNPEALMDDLSYSCQWLARSAVLVADAQYHLDAARGRVAEEVEKSLPLTIAKEVMAGRVASEARILKLAERLNATLTHRIDSIRSVLSFEKQTYERGGRS